MILQRARPFTVSFIDGMTKRQIDKYFNEFYAGILKTAKDIVRRKRLNYEAEAIVTDAYLELLEKRSKLKKKNDVERFAKQFIRLETGLPNSKTNRREKANSKHVELEDLENVIGVESWADFNRKVEKHRKETALNVVVELYEEKEGNALNFEILELIREGNETCRSLAEALGVSKDTAYRLRKEMKKDFKAFASLNGLSNI